MSAPATEQDDKKIRRHKPKPSYAKYVKDVLADVDGTSALSGKALAVVTSMADSTVRALVQESKCLLAKTGRKQVTDHDVKSVTKQMIHDDADQKAIMKFIGDAVGTYGKTDKGRLSARSGLLFPVARIGALMRKERVGTRVSPKAAVAVAAAAQHMIGDVLEYANEERKKDKVARITPRHIRLALAKPALHELCHGTIAYGGAVPCLRAELLPKTAAGKRKAEACADDAGCVKQVCKKRK